MSRRKLPLESHLYDKHRLLDLWQASRPEKDEHILAFTVNFSDTESNRLKALEGKYITIAHRVVKRLLAKASPIDVVLTMERNGSDRIDPSSSKDGLHQ